MPAVESTMIDLGTRAPDFALPNTNPNYSDAKVALSDFSEVKGSCCCLYLQSLSLCCENQVKFRGICQGISAKGNRRRRDQCQ